MVLDLLVSDVVIVLPYATANCNVSQINTPDNLHTKPTEELLNISFDGHTKFEDTGKEMRGKTERKGEVE